MVWKQTLSGMLAWKIKWMCPRTWPEEEFSNLFFEVRIFFRKSLLFWSFVRPFEHIRRFVFFGLFVQRKVFQRDCHVGFFARHALIPQLYGGFLPDMLAARSGRRLQGRYLTSHSFRCLMFLRQRFVFFHFLTAHSVIEQLKSTAYVCVSGLGGSFLIKFPVCFHFRQF